MAAVDENPKLVKRLRAAGWEKRRVMPLDDECWIGATTLILTTTHSEEAQNYGRERDTLPRA